MRSLGIILGLVLPIRIIALDHTTLATVFKRLHPKYPLEDCIHIDDLEDCILHNPLEGCILCMPKVQPTVQPKEQPTVQPTKQNSPTTPVNTPAPEEPTTTSYASPTPSPTDSSSPPAVVSTKTDTPSAPSPTDTNPAPPNEPATQSCTATDHGYWVSYSVLIRVPFGGAKDCNDTYHALENWVPISNWQCVNEDGNIRLWFNAFSTQGGTISRALELRYPQVAGGFNCPDY